MTEKHHLTLHEISKKYEGEVLLNGINLTVASGETLCLLGSSGSGKSTLLRIIAGIENADSGFVAWDDQNLEDVPTHQRNFGLVFQDYALFPHRNVFDNVAFGLRMLGESSENISKRVHEILSLVNMGAFVKRNVTDLSGGEQQRVALARALAPRPRLLMLDEPLAALDRSLREQLQIELRQILHESQIPAIYVTHDQNEALALGDRLALLHNGNIAQCSMPEELFESPASIWVAQFLGMSNLFNGKILDVHPLTIQTRSGEFISDTNPNMTIRKGQSVTMLVTPGEYRLDCSETEENILGGSCERCNFAGDHYLVSIKNERGECFSFSSHRPYSHGQTICLGVPRKNIVCLLE